MIEVMLCMGSSCFSRGNARALDLLEQFIKDEGLESKIVLKGVHCMGDCAQGPNISINKKLYPHLHPDGLIDRVRLHLENEHDK